MKVKICGITNVDDALFCERAGADYVGFVFDKASPRFVSIGEAERIAGAMGGIAERVGVFTSQSEAFIREAVERCSISVVQLHGDYACDLSERVSSCGVKVWKVFWPGMGENLLKSVDSFKCDAVLLDSVSNGRTGGTGALSNWRLAREISLSRRLVLAGGLNPENALSAAREVNPWCMDFNSGVEISPRKKDFMKIKTVIGKLKKNEKI